MKNYKIIITGPVGVGKTTAIKTISDKDPVLTDAKVTDITKKRKPRTTVAMDFGLTQFDATTRVHLYGTPGQQRFDFMWSILQKNAHALILLLDNSRKYPLKDLRLYTESFKQTIENTGLIIGITQMSEQNYHDLSAYRDWVQQLGLQAKIFRLDVREKSHMLHVVTEIINPSPDFSDQDLTSINLPEPVEQPPATAPDPIPPTSKETTTATTPTPKNTEKTVMKETIVNDIMKIRNISGVTLTNTMGEQVASNIDDEQLNEFIAFVAGMMPSFEDTADLGTVQSVILRSNTEDNIGVFLEEENALGVVFNKKLSLPNLRQQISDSVQWS